MKFASTLLEDWMRSHYYDAAIDIGSSGVLDYSLKEVRELAGIAPEEFDEIVFRDSPSLGRYDLREAIAARWGTGDADRVITTHGASEALYVLLMSLLERGDQIVTLAPAYHSHVSVAESIGCDVVRWPLREEDGFRPKLDDLAALVTDRTRVIVVNFPHNPTGVTLAPPELDRLLVIASSANAYVVWDAAFADLVYDADPLPDPAWSHSKVISVGTFSKAFGLPGMRFGWCVADPELISAMTNLRDMITLSLSPLVEFIALRVVRNADAFIDSRLKLASANRRLLIEWARRHHGIIDLPVPQGGVTAFPLVRGYEDTTGMCKRMGDAYRALLIPGRAFDHPRRVRLGFGGQSDQLAKGLQLISGVLAAHTHTEGI
jgi:capreomycidine synthase